MPEMANRSDYILFGENEMWDVIDTALVLVGLCIMAWLWWTAGRTVLDVSGKLTKEERVRAWFLLARVAAVATGLGGLVFLIQHLATGKT
jgi:hypothetical protein